MAHLLFAGLATVDLVYRVDRIPGADEKVQAGDAEIAAGGPAANAAVCAAALGADVTLLTAVGVHPLGDLIRDDLTRHGVRVIDAAGDSVVPPPISCITVLESTGQRTIVSRNAGNLVFSAPMSALPGADVTLVDGHHPELALAAARSARRLVVDAGSWRPIFHDIFPYAEVVACSAAFRPPTPIDAPWIAVTHGPDPVTWRSSSSGEVAGKGQIGDEATGTIPVPPVEAVDTAGAGDAFHGALAVGLARGLSVPAALEFAVGVAGVRVQHPGPRRWLCYLSEVT